MGMDQANLSQISDILSPLFRPFSRKPSRFKQHLYDLPPAIDFHDLYELRITSYEENAKDE